MFLDRAPRRQCVYSSPSSSSPVPGAQGVFRHCSLQTVQCPTLRTPFSCACSVWHDHYHRPVHRVRDDRNVRRPFRNGRWHLPVDHHTGKCGCDVSPLLSSPSHSLRLPKRQLGGVHRSSMRRSQGPVVAFPSSPEEGLLRL